MNLVIPGGYHSVYIRQSRIKERHPRPILVDNRRGKVYACGGVECHGPNRLVYKPEGEQSCLWFETEAALTLKDYETYTGPTE